MSSPYNNLSTVIGNVEVITECVYMEHSEQYVWITTVTVDGVKGRRKDCNYGRGMARAWHRITANRIKLFVQESKYVGVQRTNSIQVMDPDSAIADYIAPNP